jgi:lysozyme
MISQRHFVKILLLLMVSVLFLAACERPFQTNSDTTNSAETNTDVSTEAVADPNAGGGTDGTTTEESQETTEQPATTEETSETPRVEDAETDTAEETAATDQSTETTEETADSSSEEGEASETQEEGQTEEPTPSALSPVVTLERPSIHIVAAGENLYRIGIKYGVSFLTLAQHNNIINPHRIQVGQEIKIPGNETAPTPTPPATPSPQTETTYVVKAGDNLFRIGLNYGISWVQIAEANGLVNPNQLTVGQTLKIPFSAPGPSPQFTHQVKQGDTLYKISIQYGVTWNAIATANEIQSPYIIYVGQTLRIPGK